MSEKNFQVELPPLWSHNQILVLDWLDSGKSEFGVDMDLIRVRLHETVAQKENLTAMLKAVEILLKLRGDMPMDAHIGGENVFEDMSLEELENLLSRTQNARREDSQDNQAD